ncbi:HD-GYP domain-containing protein [Ornithinibacillus californiensis]|uniref:HD-GYP domain-containing protein n=1 Tax=Ornithinibacillus californiensis TaxID=161536 RepID=UPI00064D7E73|nr:HD-GYP domain-containing protein [Ornithinibacillus californiensis]
MKNTLQTSLLSEEKQATKWFLGLFYSVFLIYDVFYYYLLPTLPWGNEVSISTTNVFDYILYAVMIGLIPVSYYFMKKNKPGILKYLYFISYTSINIFSDIWFYSNSDFAYTSGNLVEIVIIIFSPIFVNKRYFYLVFFGTTFKYLVAGLFLKYSVVMVTLLVVIVLSMITFIILLRFLSYVETVTSSYDKQIEGIVKGIIATLELKDPYTRGHSERVAEYAMVLATETGKYNKDELKYFYYACLLHDIGKIHIPDAILTKPGKLTKEEYETIKMHTVVGAKAVHEVEGISANIDVVLSHHERWDGKGYPNGLKEEETPLLARITAIVDAFDAMTSSRSYRSALPFEEAYRRIIDGSGTQFDPQLVKLFMNVYPNLREIHEKHNSH